MTAEQRIFAWLERADFDGTGCRWSQENIAAACGCSRRTVIRATQKLADEGRIHSFLERRPGCKWPCRVYRVKHWNPHKRAGVLNVLRSIQERRSSECHTERTATAGKGSCLSGTPSLRASKALPARSQARTRGDSELRRTRMDQRRRPQHITVVPDLTCARCQELARELEAKDEEAQRKDDVIRRYAETETKRAEELSGAYDTIRVQGKAITNLERAKTRQARESARAEQVERVIEHWKKHRPKTRASSFPPGGKNWQTIERALTLMADDEDGSVTACCEAIDGLHIAPWEAYGKRYMRAGEGRTLRNRLEHALGDEARIERCRGIVRRVRGDGADRVYELWQVARGTEGAFFSVLLEKLGRRGMDDEVRFVEVDGISVREDGR